MSNGWPSENHSHSWSGWVDVGNGLDERSCDCGANQTRGNGKSPGEDERR
jgi:hypothetical protein